MFRFDTIWWVLSEAITSKGLDRLTKRCSYGTLLRMSLRNGSWFPTRFRTPAAA